MQVRMSESCPLDVSFGSAATLTSLVRCALGKANILRVGAVLESMKVLVFILRLSQLAAIGVSVYVCCVEQFV